MENPVDRHPEQNGGDPSSATKSHQIFFIGQLNRTYTAKRRLAEILDELLEHTLFTDLAIAVRATAGLIRGQLVRIEEIYAILSISPALIRTDALLTLIEEGYLAIGQQKETPAFELYLLTFLQTAESLELASFKILRLEALELNNPYVAELLEQCISGAEADYELLLTLMAGYFKD